MSTNQEQMLKVDRQAPYSNAYILFAVGHIAATANPAYYSNHQPPNSYFKIQYETLHPKHTRQMLRSKGNRQ